MTKFNLDNRTSMDLIYESIQEALNDADTNMDDIDAVVVSTVDSKFNEERQRHYSSMVTSLIRKQIPIIRIPAVCGGGGAAFFTLNRNITGK